MKWFFPVWLLILAFGFASPWMAQTDLPGFYIVGFWGVALLSLILARPAWSALWHWCFRPVLFVQDDLTQVPLRSPTDGMLRFLCCALTIFGLASTWFTIPFSSTAQLLTGFRHRVSDLPSRPITKEDELPSEIALLPTGKVSREQAAAVADAVRKASGLKVWCFPVHQLQGLEHDSRTRQLIVESVAQPLLELAKTLPSPAPPHDHPLLLIVLTDEDMRSRVMDWRFVLSSGFSDTLAIVSTARLKLHLPFSDKSARQRILERTQKLVLRLIGLHAFRQARDNDPKSLLGPALRSLDDLDACESRLRFDPRKITTPSLTR